MKTNVEKLDDGFAVRITKGLADKLHLDQGAEMDIDIDDSRLILTPRRVDELEALVTRITDDNRHQETDWARVSSL